MEKILEKKIAVLVLSLLLFLIFTIHLGTSSIWDSNEAFYTEVPREMLAQDSYIIPTFNFETRLNKPPLSYWTVVVAYRIFGVSVPSQRMVIVFFMFATLLVVWQLGRQLFDSRLAAWSAVVVTALSPRIFIMSRRGLIEILLLFCITASLYYFFRFYHEKKILFAIFFYICLAMGFLTKGPVALAVPGLIIVAFLLSRKNLRFVFRMWPLAGGAFFLLLTLPWYLALYHAVGSQPLIQLFVNENVNRFANELFGPIRGIFYYLKVFLVDFFPWSLLLIPLGWVLFKKWKHLGSDSRQNIVFLFLWLAVPLLFFTLSQNKQEYYIMPAYPAGALLLASGIQLVRRRFSMPGVLIWFQSICLFALLMMGGLTAFLSRRLLDAGLEGTVFVLVLLAIVVVGWWWMKTPRHWPKALAAIPLACYWTIFFVVLVVIPKIEIYRPVPRMARLILSQAQTSDTIGTFDIAAPSLCFYTRRPIASIYHADEFVTRFAGPRPFYCLVPQKSLKKVEEARIPYTILDESPLFPVKLMEMLSFDRGNPSHSLCLIVNRPPP